MTTTMIEQVYTPDLAISYPRPLFLVPVSAGFPSPADDCLEGKLDLNRMRSQGSTNCMRRHDVFVF
jgi:DNA polymerase V